MDELRNSKLIKLQAKACAIPRCVKIGAICVMFISLTGCDPCLNNPCDNGIACDGMETCTADGGQAVCTDGTAVECVDPTPVCTEPDGACIDPCEAVDCDDENDCTTDSCTLTANADGSFETDCINDPDCDDGDACTESDTCGDDGVCSGTPIECADGETCVDGNCVSDSCMDVVCGDGATCDPLTGICIDSDPQQVDVLQLGGFFYPTGLFRCADSEEEQAATESCPEGAGCDEFHWHSDMVTAITSTSGAANPVGSAISDPNGCRCGHGRVSEVTRTMITVGASELADYLSATTLSELPSAAACPP